jgi:HD-GYP domain-containing protein (c-di-GMP phosphodiesterase class II)
LSSVQDHVEAAAELPNQPEGPSDQDLRTLLHRVQADIERINLDGPREHRQFELLNRIGIALSAERDIGKLQDFILMAMREMTHADAGNLWLKRVDDSGQARMFLASSQNDSIDKDAHQAFTVPLDDRNVVGFTVTMGTSQVYDDAYNPPPGKPQGDKGYDTQYGYRTKSMLTVPMRNYTGEVMGAMQLINAKRRFNTKLTTENLDAEVVSFRPGDVSMIESNASQAAVAIDNVMLLDAIHASFEGFVQASITAIEQRDPMTAGHSVRVATLTIAIALAVSESSVGKYRYVRFTDDQIKELRYACLLHDFGKLAVPEHILVKSKKLLPGQLELIQARFEAIQWSMQAKHGNERLLLATEAGGDSQAIAEIDRRLELELTVMRNGLAAIIVANDPSSPTEDTLAMLEALAARTYVDAAGKQHPMLTPEEFRFLSIPKGVLYEQERLEMQSHVTQTFHFLSKIPWPPLLRNIPEIAYGHHEKLDGSGYPRGPNR